MALSVAVWDCWIRYFQHFVVKIGAAAAAPGSSRSTSSLAAPAGAKAAGKAAQKEITSLRSQLAPATGKGRGRKGGDKGSTWNDRRWDEKRPRADEGGKGGRKRSRASEGPKSTKLFNHRMANPSARAKLKLYHQDGRIC